MTTKIIITYPSSSHTIVHTNQGNAEFAFPPRYSGSEPSPALPLMQIPFAQFVENTPLNRMTTERDHLKARVAELEQENAQLQQTVQELTFRLNPVPPIDRQFTQQEYVNASQPLRPFNPSTYQPQEIPSNYEQVSSHELEHAFAILKTSRPERYDEVVYHTNLAIKANPHNAEAYACKSEVLRLMHRWHECNQAAESALFLHSENVIALINKGTALYHLGNYRNSLVLTEKVLQLHPHNLFALINKIGNFFCLRMFREAADTLTFAMRSHPNDPELLTFQNWLRQEFHPF